MTSFVVRIMRSTLPFWERYTDKTCGARHLERGKGTRGVVVELTPVLTLDGLDGEAELSGHPGKEVEGGKHLRLGTQWESPRGVREIIGHDQIVLASSGHKVWSSRSRKSEGVKGPSNVTSEKRMLGRQIHHSEPKGVKVDRT
jgi:hypothetical protein